MVFFKGGTLDKWLEFRYNCKLWFDVIMLYRISIPVSL